MKIKILFLLILYFLNSTQGNQFKRYDVEVTSLSPLAFNFEGQQVKACPIMYYDDLSIICRQQGYQFSQYENHTVNEIQCPQNTSDSGLYFDCYQNYNSALNINECTNIYLSDCPGQCQELICKNYRCNEQATNSHQCVSCIGDYGLRTPPNCECPVGKVDKFPQEVNCQPINPEDPVEGDLKLDGENVLQIYHNFEFKPICGADYFDEISATIACNQLGSNSYSSFEATDCPTNEQSPDDMVNNPSPSSSEYPAWFQFYSCQGGENSIQQCSRTQFQPTYCYGQCIKLQCFQLPDGDGDLRINGGVSEKNSIVEIYHYNFATELQEWRPVCDYSLNKEMAHVMCVQQGFKTVKTFFGGQECPKNNENQDDTIFWFGRLICKGNEKNLTSCRYPDGWEQDTYNCKCILLQCTNDYELPKEGSVRLDNNALEIYHDDSWGQVCTKKSLDNIGKVVCNQLRKKIKNKVNQKISLLKKATSQKQIYVCPNYTNYWISDIDCPSGNEADLLSCNINSKWGKHSCKNTDCIFIACDGEIDINNLTNFQEGNLRQREDKIIEILHNDVWKPISDSGNEYNVAEGYYGIGINKSSAHVICKQLGYATYSKIEKNQSCGNDFNGYWLGNIMCKGDEIKLTDCYHLPWGQTTVQENDNNKCVKIECSESQTCVGENKVSSSKYPYCQCADGYYEDGISSDCLKCSSYCKTCIFSAENCLECSVSQQEYNVLDYDKWYQQQGFTFNQNNPNSYRFLQYDNQDPYNGEDPYGGQDPYGQDSNEYPYSEGSDPYGEGQDYGYPQDCETEGCCSFSQYCNLCDQYSCHLCYNGGDPFNFCEGGSDMPGEQNQDKLSQCQIISYYCEECDIKQMKCTKCQSNYNIDTGCLDLYPPHHEKAPCVHISEDCIDCKGDYCYDCIEGYMEDYWCQIHQDQECKEINSHCLECDIEIKQCYVCEPNYDITTNCQNLLPIGHIEAPCIQYSPYCLECNETKCNLCMGTWDAKYNCQVQISIEEQCIQSGCKNCIGYKCLDEDYVNPDQPKPIVEFENQITISLETLTFYQSVQTMTVNPNGQLLKPTDEFIDSWGIYTCSLYCAEGYFQKPDGSCGQCSGKCQVCVGSADNCLYCKYRNNQYVGEAPGCDCLEGSKQVGSYCEECEPGFYNFEINAKRCSRCPDNANCLGGKTIDISKGFWRKSETSSSIVLCQNNENACIGGTQTEVKSQCIEGHIGALCEACDLDGSVWGEKYANSSDFECAQCKLVDNNTLKIIGINILQFVSMFISVNGTITAVQDKIKFNSLKSLFNTHEPTPDEMGVLMKILNNYLFIIGVLTTFSLQLPDGLRAFNAGVSNPTKQMSHSFYCFLKGLELEMPVIYFKVIWQILIGVFQLIFVFIVIGLGKKCKKINAAAKTIVYTTLLYQFISMQPGVITMIFETMACREIGGDRYILSNTSKKCEGAEYYTYTFTLMIPLLLIWVILIPYFFYRGLKSSYNKKIQPPQILQQENKEQKYQVQVQQQQSENEFFQVDQDQILDRKAEQLKKTPKECYLERALPLGKYGYMYLEYKNNVYWWEFVKIYQRILIAMTLAFYYNDIKVKGIIIFMIVFFYTVLSIRYKPYRLDTHNRIDIMSGAITGVTLILGIFIYNNDYPEWVIIAAVLMGCINAYFLILMITKIAYGKVKNIVSKTTVKIETNEQIALFEQQMKERKTIIGNIKELENKLTSLQNENKEGNQEKIDQVLQQISEQNKQIIAIEDLLFTLEYLPKKKLEELQKEIEELPSFIIKRGFEQNKQKEIELKLRYSNVYNQNRGQEEVDNYNEQIPSKILEQDDEENESPVKITQNNEIKDQLNNKNIMEKIQNPTETLRQSKSQSSEEDNNMEQNTKKPSESIQQKQENKLINLQQSTQQNEFTERDEEAQMINQNKIKIKLRNSNENSKILEKSTDSKRRRSSIQTGRNFTKQITVSLQDHTQQFNQLDKKSQIKQRTLGRQSIQTTSDYSKFQNDRKKQKDLKKPNIVIRGIIKIGEVILSLFVGKTSAEDMRKAKFLRNMIKFYFKNLLVDGYQAGLIELSLKEEEQNNQQLQIHVPEQQYIEKYQISDLLKGDLQKSEQELLHIHIQDEQKFQEEINQQILQKVTINYAKILKEQGYDKIIWEEKLKENSDEEKKKNIEIVKYDEKIEKFIEYKVNLYSQILTKEDILQEYIAFKLFDIKGKKIVTGENIQDIMIKLGQNISKKVLDKMINQVDNNGNGEVDFCEFLALVSSRKQKSQDHEIIREIFNFFCSESNGKIDYLDIDLMLRNLFNIKESKSVLQEVIRGIDQNSPETLDIVSFLRLIY